MHRTTGQCMTRELSGDSTARRSVNHTIGSVAAEHRKLSPHGFLPEHSSIGVGWASGLDNGHRQSNQACQYQRTGVTGTRAEFHEIECGMIVSIDDWDDDVTRGTRHTMTIADQIPLASSTVHACFFHVTQPLCSKFRPPCQSVSHIIVVTDTGSVLNHC